MSKELYQYPIYPLRRIINYIPGDVLFDVVGNIYEVTDNYDVEYIVKSPLQQEFLMDGLSEVQFSKLYVPITDKLINKYYSLSTKV